MKSCYWAVGGLLLHACEALLKVWKSIFLVAKFSPTSFWCVLIYFQCTQIAISRIMRCYNAAITLQWQIRFRHVLIPGSIWHVFLLSISSNVFHMNHQFNANAKPRAHQILQPNWAWNGCKYDHWLMKMCNVCCTDLFGVHKILMFGIDCSLWCGPIAVRW